MVARLTNMRIYLLLAAATLGQANVLKEHVRHSSNTKPIEINVDPNQTYDKKFMGLMNTACRPETDGYFGATYGPPLTLEYGFKMETQPLASITDILDAVDDYVVDATLSNYFPEMCGYRRRQLARELGRASGFRFDKFEEITEPCTPEMNPVNFCGVFKGRVEVYGREQGDTALDILSMVDEVLNTEDPSSLHADLVRIQSEDSLTVIPTFRSSGGGNKLSNVGKALILFAIVFVVSAVLWLFVSRRKRSPLHKSATMSTYASNSRSKSTLYNRVFHHRKNKNKYKDYNPEERSIKTSMEPEAVAFGAGSRLLLTDGRPVEVEFVDDIHNSGNTSVMDSHMDMSLDPRAEYI